MAKEAAEALKQASYDRRVQKTKIQLAEDLAEVCRDYCKEVWAEALNWPSTTQASLPPPEVSKGPSKAGDQGQEAKAAKGKRVGQDGTRLEDKRKGKEVKPLLEAKGTEAAFMVKDAIFKS
nr:hypothetical protein CFP56_55832 [Quercus suber]